MQRLFSSSGKPLGDAWKSWAAMSRREFYDGELESDTHNVSDSSFEKTLCYPISVTHLTSRDGLSYRRSWQHIRGNKVGFRVIWFVVRGSLKIVRTQGVCHVRVGEAGIVHSNSPFRAACENDADGVHESYQAIIPAHLFLTHLQKADSYIEAFSLTDTAEGRAARHLLDVLVDDGRHLSRQAIEPLVQSLLETIADTIGCRETAAPRRPSLIDDRLAAIQTYILMNLTDPDLCYDKVAASCGISRRYLCYVLKANNTSFSELLWKNRLPKARDWLVAPATRDYPIHEIAFMSGFKSAAHFSRMFKATYGCSPREYRANHTPNAATQQEVADYAAPEQLHA